MTKFNPPLSETHPHLVSEWNDERDIHKVTAGSKYRASWKCNLGHQWNILVLYRTHYGNNCPFCANKKILVGYNDLATTHPHLVDEWADSRDITEFTKGSKKKVSWKCLDYSEHVYEATIQNKIISKTGCPYCFGRRVFKGFNDIATTHPEISSEWDHQRNDDTVHDVSAGSNKMRWWVCKDNPDHVWEAKIATRTYHKSGCHYCRGLKVLQNSNDLATTHPHLVKEWDDEQDIVNFTSGAHYQAQWKCQDCEHTWQAKIYNRSKGARTECPKCSRAKKISKKEQEVYDQILNIVPDNTLVEQSNRTVLQGTEAEGIELDIYLPDLKVAIEFNGLYWHTEAYGKTKYYHKSKYTACKEKGVRLFTIWEDDWDERQEVVKSMLRHKLGLSSPGHFVYARNTHFSRVSVEEGSDFLNSHHLQGQNKTSKHYALKDTKNGENESVAVMSTRFNQAKKELEIKRFATSKNVPGGFTKLLKNIIKEHVSHYTNNGEYFGANTIVSYAHNDHSWGEVYAKNDFVKIHDGAPGYFYVRNNRREFRLNYSPKRFRERTDLIFEEEMTERELASLNGLERLWDCGSARWEKPLVVSN